MAATLITIASLYLAGGLLVAAVFLVLLVDRIDPNAKGAWAFRPLIAPGVVLLWPVVLVRWRALSAERGNQGDGQHAFRPPRRAQAALALALSLAIPVIVVGALLARQNGPLERPAVLLETPAAAPAAPSEGVRP